MIPFCRFIVIVVVIVIIVRELHVANDSRRYITLKIQTELVVWRVTE